jgi:predicted MFS family arabinose efflux permease
LRVFIPFALGYFLSYLYRVVNAVIAPDLVAELGIGSAGLGLLTAVYFLTFAAFQLPLGVLLDRFGPRRVEAALLVLAGAGALLFARAETTAGLVLGRGLIGLGVSACLMAAFTAFVFWFPRHRLPGINGLQLAAGGLGAVTATAPVQFALQATDWRGVFLILGAVTLAAAAGVYLVVPEGRQPDVGAGLRSQLRGIVTVFTSPVFWRVAPWCTFSQAAFLSIQGLWAGPWLRDVAGLQRPAVAQVLFWVALAMVAGFILMGRFTQWLGQRGVPVRAVAAAGMGGFMAVQVLVILEAPLRPLVLWAAFGLFGTSGILCYADLTQQFPGTLSGRVNTGLNLLVFVAAFAAQWGIGAVITLWPPGPAGAYAAAGYQAGFGMMLGLQLLALAWFGWAGRRRPKPV